jgi:predicted nucleic acid-binding Zn ribbon protein
MSRRKAPASLGDLIPEVVDDLGLTDRLDEARIEAEWRAMAGPRIGRITRRVRLHGDRLVVQLDSATWRQALHMQREEWRQKINEAIGRERVREIVFR